MNVQEFSNEFDVLLSAYSVIPPNGFTDPIALNEYEKSVYLTQAQEQIVVELYLGKYDGDSFERTEEIRRYLSNLVKTFETSEKVTGKLGLSKTSIFFTIPEDVWFITYESAIINDERLGCLNKTEAVIVPTTQDEYYRIAKNPFRGPSEGRILRLDLDNNVIELVSNYNIDKYLVRYLSKPSPIVLTNLTGVSVGGISTITECKLDEALHRIILERAVRLALITKTQYTNK